MGFFNNFPYTNFHDINLDWIMKTVKDSVEKIENYMKKTTEYIKNYFNNLDISQEVDNKLEDMAETGSLQKYLDPFMLKGKKCVFFGDSITWGDIGDSTHSQADRPYPTIISEKAGCESINKATKSATLTIVGSSTNNLKTQIESTDFSNVDFVFICFGINDFGKNVPIGSIDSEDWGCIYGALYNAIRAINAKNNSSEIVILSVPPTRHILSQQGNTWRCHMLAYVEAIGSFCLTNKIRYIDILHNSGIDALNLSYYSPDGVHFNQNGYNLLADCILYNMGGNTPYITSGVDVWDIMQYPNTDKLGRYALVRNGETLPYNSYNEITLNSGLYLAEFDYFCECSDYNMKDGFVGFNFKLGDNYIVSPIGIYNGQHKMRVAFKLNESASGIMLLRPTIASTVQVTLTTLEIENFKLIPLTGRAVFGDTVSVTSNVFNGTATVTRYNNGVINFTVNGSLTSDVARYGIILNSSALRKFVNIDIKQYFTIYTDKEILRGQITNSGLAVNKALTSGTNINFTVILIIFHINILGLNLIRKR